ncbi:MAG: tetratricopeptide repeat protein [Chloroflexota bacterium]
MAKRKNKKQFKKKLARIQSKQSAGRPQNKIKEAISSLDEGQYEAAINLADDLLQKSYSPEIDAKAAAIAVEAFFRSAAQEGALTSRVELLQAAVDYNPADSRLFYHLGITYLQVGELDKAAEAVRSLAKVSPNHPQLAYIQALIQAGSGKVGKAKNLSSGQNATLQLIRGIQSGEDKESLQPLAQQALPHHPELWEALLKMAQGKTTAPQQALTQALENLKKSANHSSQEGVALIVPYYQGVAAMRKKEKEQAQQHWARIEALDTPWYRENLGRLRQEEITKLATAGEWNQIIVDYGDLISRLDPGKNKVLDELLGTTLFHTGYQAASKKQWEQAASHWQSASQFMTNRILLQNMALVQEAMGDWYSAAESWRDMIKRRPRKESHPDYLTDTQVAAIWGRAGTAYGMAELYEDGITCFKNALKYDEENVGARMALVSFYMEEERAESAINELHRILEIDPENLDALKHLALLYQYDSWRYDAKSIWLRILEIKPTDREAQDALAESYIEEASRLGYFYHHLSSKKRDPGQIFKEGLEKLPNHPKLLVALGMYTIEVEENEEEGLGYLKQAWQATPGDLQITGIVLEHLLINGDFEFVKQMIPQVQKTTRAPAAFWLVIAKEGLENEIDHEWVQHIWEQAYEVAQGGSEPYTPLLTLLIMFEDALDLDEEGLAEQIKERVKAEAPNSGADEYMKAHEAAYDGDTDQAKRFLRKAKNKLRKRNDNQLMDKLEEFEDLLSRPAGGLFGAPGGILDMFEEMGLDPMGPPPSPMELMEILSELDEDTLDEFKRIVGD